MIFLITFLVELFILFFLAQKISLKLSEVFFKIYKNEKTVIKFLSFIFLPGTIIHELSHMFLAEFLFVKTGNMEFMPKIQNDGNVKLGSVGIANCDPFRRFLIGIAPVIGGVGILSLFFYLFGNGEWGFNFKTVILLIVSFEIGNTMFSSKKDMEGAIALVISLIIAGGILFVIGKGFSYLVLNFLFLSFNKAGIFFKNIDLILIFPILIDVFAFFILNLFIGRTSKGNRG